MKLPTRRDIVFMIIALLPVASAILVQWYRMALGWE